MRITEKKPLMEFPPAPRGDDTENIFSVSFVPLW